jgi:hypothetical protein
MMYHNRVNYPTRAENEKLSPDGRLRLIEDISQSFEGSRDDLPLSGGSVGLQPHEIKPMK